MGQLEWRNKYIKALEEKDVREETSTTKLHLQRAVSPLVSPAGGAVCVVHELTQLPVLNAFMFDDVAVTS